MVILYNCDLSVGFRTHTLMPAYQRKYIPAQSSNIRVTGAQMEGKEVPCFYLQKAVLPQSLVYMGVLCGS